MKESIYTIPISEVFEPKTGCPICSLESALEDRWAAYITGAAMMEPDVRIATNEEGFCADHLSKMLLQRNRLSVALMLQTRLEHVLSGLDKPPAAVWGRPAQEDPDSCFLCHRIDGELARLCGNIAVVWAHEEDFRALYAQQQFVCHRHGAALRAAAGALRKAPRKGFLEATADLLRKGLAPAKEDIDAFCMLFDYRSNSGDKPSPEVAAAVERAAAALCGRRFTRETTDR